MNQHIMNITGTTAGINRFDAEGAWGGASWDGILNVGMYLFKEFNKCKKWKHFVIKEYDSEWKNIARQEMKQITEHLSPFESIQNAGVLRKTNGFQEIKIKDISIQN